MSHRVSVTSDQLNDTEEILRHHSQKLSSALSDNLLMTLDDLNLLEALQREQAMERQRQEQPDDEEDEDEEDEEDDEEYESEYYEEEAGVALPTSPSSARGPPSPPPHAMQHHQQATRVHSHSAQPTPTRSTNQDTSTQPPQMYSTHTTPHTLSTLSRAAISPQQRTQTTMDSADNDDADDADNGAGAPAISPSEIPSSSSDPISSSLGSSLSSALVPRRSSAAPAASSVALAPLTRRSADREFTSLKGQLKRTSLDLNSSIITLERQLASERSKNMRLHEQRKQLETSCELAQREAQGAKLHVEQLTSDLRTSNTKVEDQRKYIVEVETKFGIGGISIDEPLIATRKKLAQVQTQLTTCQADLEKQRNETLKAQLVAEEQRAFIDVLKRALDLRVQDINEQLGSGGVASSKSNDESTTSLGSSKKSRVLEGMSSRLASSTPSHAHSSSWDGGPAFAAAVAAQPLHLTKYSLVELAARSCKRELDVQLSIALARQHEAEDALKKVSAESQRQLDKLKRSLEQEFNAAHLELTTKMSRRDAALDERSRDLDLRSAKVDSDFQQRLKVSKDEFVMNEKHLKEEYTVKMNNHTTTTNKIVEEVRAKLEQALAALKSEQSDKSKLIDSIDEFQHRIGQLELELNSKDGRIGAIEQECAMWQSQAQELESVIDGMTTSLQSAERRSEELAANTASLNVLEKAYAMLQVEHTSVKDVLEHVETDAKESMKVRATLEERIMNLECEVTRLTHEKMLKQQQGNEHDSYTNASGQPNTLTATVTMSIVGNGIDPESNTISSTFSSPKKSVAPPSSMPLLRSANDGRLSPSALNTPAPAPMTRPFAASSTIHGPSFAQSTNQQPVPMAASLGVIHAAPHATVGVASDPLASSSYGASSSDSLESHVARARDLGALQARLSHFESLHASFEAQLIARDADRQALVEEVRLKEAQLIEVRQSLVELTQKHVALQHTSHAVERDLASSMSETNSRVTEVESTRIQLRDAHDKLEALRSEKRSLQKEYTSLQTAFGLLQQELATATQQHAHALRAAQNEVNLVRHELLLQHSQHQSRAQDEFDAEKRSLESTLRSLESQITSLRDHSRLADDAHSHEILLLKQQVDEKDSVIRCVKDEKSALEVEVHKHSVIVDRIKSDCDVALSELRTRMSEQELEHDRNLARLDEKLHAERSTNVVAHARIASLEEMVDTLKTSMAAAHNEALKNKEEQARMHTSAEEARRQKAILQTELDQYKHSMQLVEQQLSEYKLEVESELRDLTRARDSASHRASSLESERDQLVDDLHHLRATSSEQVGQVQRLKEEILSKENIIRDQEYQYKALEKQVYELRKQAQEMQFELKENEKRISDGVENLRAKDSQLATLHARLSTMKRSSYEDTLWVPSTGGVSARTAANLREREEERERDLERVRERERERDRERQRARERDRERERVHEALQSDRHRRRPDDRREDAPLSSTLHSPSPVRHASSHSSRAFGVDASLSSSLSSHSYGGPAGTSAASRPSKVDERLKKIQSTFAKLKSDKL